MIVFKKRLSRTEKIDHVLKKDYPGLNYFLTSGLFSFWLGYIKEGKEGRRRHRHTYIILIIMFHCCKMPFNLVMVHCECPGTTTVFNKNNPAEKCVIQGEGEVSIVMSLGNAKSPVEVQSVGEIPNANILTGQASVNINAGNNCLCRMFSKFTGN